MEKHYDTLDVGRIAEWLILHGACSTCIAVILRHQLFTQLAISVGSVEIHMRQRCIGSLTGSRIASALGRVPVEATLHSLVPQMRLQCFRCGEASLMACSFVDNIYFPAQQVTSAHANVVLFQLELEDSWGQRLKPSSMSLFACHGADLDGTEDIIDDGWSLGHEDVVLGWSFDGSGSFRFAWDSLRPKLWNAYHAQFRKPGTARAGLRRKLTVLDRCVLPVFLRAVEPWPFTRTTASNIDHLQRHMVACLYRIPRNYGEDTKHYMRRRGRFAASLIGLPWSKRWAKNVCKWEDHLHRDWWWQRWHYKWRASPALLRTSFSWAATLRAVRDSSWVAEHRISRDLRALPGGVATRWHEGLELAHARCTA